MSCSKTMIVYHVTARPNVPKILRHGFKPGFDPKRSRIGHGIYAFTKLRCAIRFAEKTNGKILTCAMHTTGTIFDLGEKDYFTSKWVCGGTGIGIGRHWQAMNQHGKFN